MLIKECRICYEDETENDDIFIYPCACSGTRKYVHASCLQQWRETNVGRDAWIQCSECNEYYNLISLCQILIK